LADGGRRGRARPACPAAGRPGAAGLRGGLKAAPAGCYAALNSVKFGSIPLNSAQPPQSNVLNSLDQADRILELRIKSPGPAGMAADFRNIV
ncbi:hypothetical protein QWZ14_31455, partial [Paeniroseomonas aquatica]